MVDTEVPLAVEDHNTMIKKDHMVVKEEAATLEKTTIDHNIMVATEDSEVTEAIETIEKVDTKDHQ